MAKFISKNHLSDNTMCYKCENLNMHKLFLFLTLVSFAINIIQAVMPKLKFLAIFESFFKQHIISASKFTSEFACIQRWPKEKKKDQISIWLMSDSFDPVLHSFCR